MPIKLEDLPKEVQEKVLADAPYEKASQKLFSQRKVVLKRHKPGEMNDTEKAWSEELERRKQAGLIADWWFEGITLKLAKKTSYTGDFAVLEISGLLTFQEVKALWKKGDSWQSASKIKYKVAAEKFYCFDFMAVYGRKKPKKDGGGWEWKEERYS